MLKEIYDKLLEQDYWPVKIYPLLKLYEYYEEQKIPEKFFGFIKTY